MHMKIAVAALALMFAGASAAHANLLTNGDFETGTIAGWTASSPYELFVYSGPFTGLGDAVNEVVGAQSGSYYLADGFPSSLATIAQGFADRAGATYQVTGWVASDGGTPSGFSLSVGGVVFGAESTVPQQTWTEYTGTFVGTGYDTLTIATQNGPHFNFFDNFDVEPIPEAPGWGMLLVGLTGLRLARRTPRSFRPRFS